MFEPENRVCPNCGANSFTNGICDFCGAKVFVSSDGVVPVQHQEESKNSVIVRTYGQFSDVYITKVRTCYYKRNCMYFTDSKNNRRELWFGYREEKDTKTIFFTFHNEGSTTIDTGDCQFRLDSEELSRTNLERICRAKELNVLFTDSKIRNADIIILLAQAFYNRIFDKSAYLDAEGKLCQLFNTKDTIDTQNKNPEIEKTKGNRGLKKSEKKEKEDWKKAKERENFQSCLLVLLIVGSLAILRIVASHIFKPVGW